ncbi:phenazine biosynthesis protein PhzF [Prauserella marina]|uniref:Phenazine biosynthesis protein PhzF family n=1 Tax=Prauserella marina TaxID=530584 RepID=A0A222VP79_9PSEU|nr:PhzF family phenazine biosynthesis protein [Prauserella marina]ASR35718.1 phenazine biosynthesis protein PhzF [Prauserella marina]PWV84401.1 PhzF family phenazine biosynthesis protein [Prauserella marina]SDC23497.1 phenazine biosynthesis protein PhzF family [Prauserella marina]
MTFTVHLVDVFASGSLTGNPLAVVTGADDVETTDMQRLTRWFGFSETTFLLPPTQPEADYRVRIFTLDREMPFAGHPTLGTARVWLATAGAARGRGELVQECGAGLVRVRREGDLLSFAAPPLLKSGRPTAEELSEATRFLGLGVADVLDASWIDNGPGWLGIRLASAEAVLSLSPEPRWPGRVDIGVVGPHPAGRDTSFEVRAFFSDQLGAIVEDPVTGSLNASIGQWLYATGVVAGPYVAAQGTSLGRSGRVHVHRDAEGQIWTGGQACIHVRGELEL